MRGRAILQTLPKSPASSNTSLAPLVLAWWADNARELPWRETRDPWLVLVSEIMAQQTQVDRVVPKWREFITRFPTPSSMAAASPGDVISMWVGLGYNRRALMLHQCATQIVEEHQGEIPQDLASLLALPGIGPYTARAVLVFAFERDVAVLDTNVGRVLARVFGRTLTPREAQGLADELVPSGRGWEWNQAVLDFGAEICQKRTPRCERCPIREACHWRGAGSDPAVGTAAASTPQSPFVGSDRQGRAKLVARLRDGPAPLADAHGAMGFADDPDRSRRVLDSLLRDGLVILDHDKIRLP